MPTLSYKEKSLYATLAVELVVFIPYFIHLIHTHSGRVGGLATLLAAAQLVPQVIIALTSRNRVTDERDRLIEARGYQGAYFALVVGIVATFCLLWTGPVFSSILLINVLFAALVFAELAKLITQLVSYRTTL